MCICTILPGPPTVKGPIGSPGAVTRPGFTTKAYECRRLVVITNLPFARWSEVFLDATAAAAVIDRIVHHATVLKTEGDCYRLEVGVLVALPVHPSPALPAAEAIDEGLSPSPPAEPAHEPARNRTRQDRTCDDPGERS